MKERWSDITDDSIEDELDPTTNLDDDPEIARLGFRELAIVKDPRFDTDESVRRYISGEFSSVTEAEEKEEAVRKLSAEVPEMLRKYCIEKASLINEELIAELMGYGYEDLDDIENLYFYTWDIYREEFGSATKVKFEHMIDIAKVEDSDHVEKEQNDSALIKLIGIGVDADAIFDQPGSPDQKRVLRRLSWILDNEPSLDDLVMALKGSKELGASIEPNMLAVHVSEFLKAFKESMDSMDSSKMSLFDQSKHKVQSSILRCSVALAGSF